jgi:hypothetical protein
MPAVLAEPTSCRLAGRRGVRHDVSRRSRLTELLLNCARIGFNP